MSDLTEVTGMVISAMPVGEFDRRIVLLTKERGKISAFAKGARRPKSPLMGITRAFVFGKFWLYEGRTSYTVHQAEISNYFESLITDLDAVCYGYYFAELAEYYARENLDASEMINLLYVALRALEKNQMPKELIRYAYEMRLISMNGECPDFFTCAECREEGKKLRIYSAGKEAVYCVHCIQQHSVPTDGVTLQESTFYAIQYMITAPLQKLFGFTVSTEVLYELRLVLGRLRAVTFDKVMKSEEMLHTPDMDHT